MPDRNKAFEFLNEVEVKENKEKKVIKKGTVFKLSFKLNAYNIHLFNIFGENEILLQPEAKYQIFESKEFNEIINLSCKIIESSMVLKDIIEGNKSKNKGKKIIKI